VIYFIATLALVWAWEWRKLAVRFLEESESPASPQLDLFDSTEP
jgi:hypothetical protein